MKVCRFGESIVLMIQDLGKSTGELLEATTNSMAQGSSGKIIEIEFGPQIDVHIE
jgi:hypothetical protein